MLFNVLSAHPELWSLYRESASIIERHFPVAMTAGSSDLVEYPDVDDDIAAAIAQSFAEAVGNMGSGHLLLTNGVSSFLRTPFGRRLMKVPVISDLRLSMIYSRIKRHPNRQEIRIVEKTPENSFRVQLLRQVFPDALFLFITRNPRSSIASIHAGWTESTEFRRFRFPADFGLTNYDSRWWCFGLVPKWESLNGSGVMEVCARQWVLYNEYCRRDLPTEDGRTLKVSYEDMVTDGAEVLRKIAKWADLDPSPFNRFGHSLPVVNTFTSPQATKWRRFEVEINKIEPLICDEARILGYEL